MLGGGPELKLRIQVPASHASLEQAGGLLQLTGQRRLFPDSRIHTPPQHPGFGLKEKVRCGCPL